MGSGASCLGLTATDPGALSHTVSRTYLPRKVSVALAATPAGPNLTLNGSTVAPPFTFTSWQGWVITLGAPNQTIGPTKWRWVSWSDGGAQTHTVTTRRHRHDLHGHLPEAGQEGVDRSFSAGQECVSPNGLKIAEIWPRYSRTIPLVPPARLSRSSIVFDPASTGTTRVIVIVSNNGTSTIC